MHMACRLCSEHGWSWHRVGERGGQRGSRDRQHHAGVDDACACWMQPHHQMAPAAPAQRKSNEPSCLLHPVLQGAPPSGEEEEGTCFQWAVENSHALPWHWHLQTGPSQMPGFVSSLGSRSHDPSQSEAASQFHLFVQQRWRPQFIPSECLKSLPSSSLPPQRLQEVSRKSDSAGVVVASNSIPRR